MNYDWYWQLYDCAYITHNRQAGAAPSLHYPFERQTLNEKYYSESVVTTLAKYHRIRRDLGRRPLFIFSRGGEEGDPANPHPARRDLRRYIEGSSSKELRNVICLKAEAIAADRVFKGMDLLTQEAIIADVADWLVIFAESVGSFCELGAFASLPHVQSITSVAVDQKFRGGSSFLLDGPVETIKRVGTPLSKVFYLDQMCPLSSTEFTEFVNGIRTSVKKSEKHGRNAGRKNLNIRAEELYIGSLVHELLDLVFLASPIFEDDLVELYCAVKGFDQKRLRIRSRVLEKDMNKGDRTHLEMTQVVSFMASSGMIAARNDKASSKRLLSTRIVLSDYFMFLREGSDSLDELRKKMVLDKRRDGVVEKNGLYRRSAV